MPTTSTRLLIVGPIFPDTAAALERLVRRGWGAYGIESLGEAMSTMKTLRFDVVLAPENLRDGRGYELAPAVANLLASLLVSVTLSESCLWLPVVYWGKNVLGERALNPRMLESELELLLSHQVGERASTNNSTGSRANAGGVLKGMIPPLREPLVAIPGAAWGTRAEDRLLPAGGKGEAQDADRFEAGVKLAAAGMRHPARHD
jgi:hypothetical protein